MIQYLRHKEIDNEKWDRCIDSAPNGMIYAFSWYLDRLCPGWDALVEDNYTHVMPLPVRSKLGISYVFTPFFIQQLGIFGPDPGKIRTSAFLNEIPLKFRLVDLKFNEMNQLPADYSSGSRRNNYILAIGREYESIRSGYNRNCKRNIARAESSGLKVGEAISAAEFARFILTNLEEQVREMDMASARQLEHIKDDCLRKGKAELVAVRDKSGEIHAAGSFLFHRQRLIFSVCASTPEGRDKQAMYLLVDSLIRKHAGRFEWFDFSGSEIKGVAYFNSTFGAKAVTYPMVHINRLNKIQRFMSGKKE